jgi:hypothetical protein
MAILVHGQKSSAPDTGKRAPPFLAEDDIGHIDCQPITCSCRFSIASQQGADLTPDFYREL